jgi:hypothetical protein
MHGTMPAGVRHCLSNFNRIVEPGSAPDGDRLDRGGDKPASAHTDKANRDIYPATRSQSYANAFDPVYERVTHGRYRVRHHAQPDSPRPLRRLSLPAETAAAPPKA